jgi:hypothetical protein
MTLIVVQDGSAPKSAAVGVGVYHGVRIQSRPRQQQHHPDVQRLSALLRGHQPPFRPLWHQPLTRREASSGARKRADPAAMLCGLIENAQWLQCLANNNLTVLLCIESQFPVFAAVRRRNSVHAWRTVFAACFSRGLCVKACTQTNKLQHFEGMLCTAFDTNRCSCSFEQGVKTYSIGNETA